MGYWEQIGVDNERSRERDVRKPLWRRRLVSAFGLILLGAISLAAYGVIAWAFWRAWSRL